MPKTIPNNGDLNWGTTLNTHLSQITDPTNGGINISPLVSPVANDIGHTYVNGVEKKMYRYDGSAYQVILEDTIADSQIYLKADELVGDNLTDNRSLLQEYIDQSSEEGKILYICPGQYRITDTIYLKTNTHIKAHPDAKFIFPSGLSGSGGSTRDGVGFYAFGSIGEKVALSGNANQFNTNFLLSNTAGINPGDLILIGDNFELRNNINKPGELAFVKSISGNTVELESQLRDNYTTNNSAFIFKITPVENVTFEGGQVISSIASNNASMHVGIRMENCINAHIKNTRVISWNIVGIELAACLNSSIRGCVGGNINSSESGLGYFMQCNQGTEGAVIEGNYGFNVGKLWDCSGFSGRNGVVRNIKVVNNHGKGCLRELFAVHGNGTDIYFAGNSGDAPELPLIRGWNITLVNNHFVASGTRGLQYRPDGRPGYFKFIGNIIENDGVDGVIIRGGVSASWTTKSYDYIEVSNNKITCSQGSAIRINARALAPVSDLIVVNNLADTNGNAPAIEISAEGNNINRGVVTGNIAKSINLSGSGAINLNANSGSIIDKLVVSNNITSGGSGVDTSGGGTINAIINNNN